MTKLIKSLTAIAALTITVPAVAAEKRCGWLDNPTPANWWFTDADGEWTIGVQGGYQAPGMDNMPDMSTNGWVSHFGRSYGYGCACMTVDTNRKTKRIARIYSASPIPLKRCRADRKLPKK